MLYCRKGNSTTIYLFYYFPSSSALTHYGNDFRNKLGTKGVTEENCSIDQQCTKGLMTGCNHCSPRLCQKENIIQQQRSMMHIA